MKISALLEPSDLKLMRRVAEGDQVAFQRLSHRHATNILALAKQTIGNEADAQDITQEVLISLWRQAPTWEDRQVKLSSWLYRVTLNRCFNHLERVKNRYTQLPEETLNEIVANGDSPEGILDATQQQDAYQQALGILPDRQKAAITLFYGLGSSTKETAEALELSIKATESLLTRARQNLKKQLNGE